MIDGNNNNNCIILVLVSGSCKNFDALKMMRNNSRESGSGSSSLVRRMVNLPRNIIGEFSRAMGHGIDSLMEGIAGRRHHQPVDHQNVMPANFHPQFPPTPAAAAEEWSFLTSFEQQYGERHPFFYACRFADALKMARDEHKFVFMYLHSPEHPFTSEFCIETLQSEVVVQFLDANFVCWGGLVDRGEGSFMAASMRPGTFPFCALIAPASGDSISVLQQLEGPITPAELVGILQRTMEEQGLAFVGSSRKKEGRRREEQLLREEQDAAYLAALQIDKEKDRLKTSTPKLQESFQKQKQVPNESGQERLNNNAKKQQSAKAKEPAITAAKHKPRKDDAKVVQILIRFPNGEKREQSFYNTDKIQAIYTYINSLGLPGIENNYRLVSNFPRRVYGAEQLGMKLKDAGVQSRASLFLELL